MEIVHNKKLAKGMKMSIKDVIRMTLLVTGAGVIIAAAYHTLGYFTDRTVFTILVPGFVAGLILIGLYVATGDSEEIKESGEGRKARFRVPFN